MSSGDDWFKKYEAMQDDYNAALNFAINEADGAQDAMDFLVAWREGDWGRQW